MSDTIHIGSLLLCEPVDALRLDEVAGAQAVQVGPLFRATHARVFARGNRTVQVQFTRTRAPAASVAAARAYLADHEAELATLVGEQAAEFIFSGPGGGVTRYLRDAVLTAHRATQIGATTTHTYTLQGSRWSNSATA